MKKALITVVGLAGFNNFTKEVFDPVSYIFKEKGIEAKKYNMLEFMIDEYGDKYEIIPLFTKEAKNAQKSVFEKAGKPEYVKIFKHPLAKEIDSENIENSYDVILKKIDEILDFFSDEDEIIIDITHGFRHLPILMIIDAIIHKLKDPSKIKKIYFAKELERNRKYEIVDITEYLELTLFVIMINLFLDNFTIADNFKFNIKEFEDVKNELQKFREHILSNSIKSLIDKNGIIDNIIKELNELIKNKKKVEVFKDKIEQIESFLSEFKENYKQIPVYLAHFETAKILFEKKYLLNAVTFLIESQSLLAKNIIEKVDNKVKNNFYEAQKRNKDYYILHTAKSFFAFSDNLGKFKSNYFEKDNNKKIYLINKKNYDQLKQKCKSVIDVDEFREILKKTNNIRNTLAHINMKKTHLDIEKDMKKVIEKYEKFLKSLEI